MSRPFLKWAGGKTQLLSLLLEVIPQPIETYYEPFLGGGALFFALAQRNRFHQAILNDFNPDLIECYRAVLDVPEEVIYHLKEMPCNREFYESIRKVKPKTLSQRAARIIYLNKTTYNGLYRVNRRGEFNAPFGAFGRTPRILDAENLRNCSETMRYGISLYTGDFVQAIDGAREGDVVYFDPPYVPINTTSGFTNYTRDGFTLDDQRRLAICFRDLAQKGVKAVLSNSDTAVIRDTYQEFDLHSIPVRRPINSVGTARGFVAEVLVFNFPDDERATKLAEARWNRKSLPIEGQEGFDIAMELGTSKKSFA